MAVIYPEHNLNI